MSCIFKRQISGLSEAPKEGNVTVGLIISEIASLHMKRPVQMGDNIPNTSVGTDSSKATMSMKLTSQKPRTRSSSEAHPFNPLALFWWLIPAIVAEGDESCKLSLRPT